MSRLVGREIVPVNEADGASGTEGEAGEISPLAQQFRKEQAFRRNDEEFFRRLDMTPEERDADAAAYQRESEGLHNMEPGEPFLHRFEILIILEPAEGAGGEPGDVK